MPLPEVLVAQGKDRREADLVGQVCMHDSVVHLREALARAGLAEDLLDATASSSGAMNESALWLAPQSGNPSARDSAHRVLDRLLAAVLT